MIACMIQITKIKNIANPAKTIQHRCPPPAATSINVKKEPHITAHPSPPPVVCPHLCYLRHPTTKPVISGEADLGTCGTSGGRGDNPQTHRDNVKNSGINNMDYKNRTCRNHANSTETERKDKYAAVSYTHLTLPTKRIV